MPVRRVRAHPLVMADAGQVLSRPDLEKMIDPLAAQVHDAWMRQRQAEGWSWGAVHNAALKQHPCLVAYEQLPESEKEVDRRTARTAIQGLMGLGFEVLPQKQSLAAESTAFARPPFPFRSCGTSGANAGPARSAGPSPSPCGWESAC